MSEVDARATLRALVAEEIGDWHFKLMAGKLANAQRPLNTILDKFTEAVLSQSGARLKELETQVSTLQVFLENAQAARDGAQRALVVCEARLTRFQQISHSRAVQLENCGRGDLDTRAHRGNADTPDELYLSFEHCQHPDCRAARPTAVSWIFHDAEGRHWTPHGDKMIPVIEVVGAEARLTALEATAALVGDILEEYASDRTKAACDACDYCGPVAMCSFHSVLSAMDKGTWTSPAIEREHLHKQLAECVSRLRAQHAQLVPYLKHHMGCHVLSPYAPEGEVCTCGLAEIRAETP